MLASLLSEDLEPLKRVILEKTEGNPFFIEETIQALLDEGALVRNGTVKLTKPLNQLKIPPTVQAILAASEARNLIDAGFQVLEKLPENRARMEAELWLRKIESTLSFVVYGASSKQRERVSNARAS
jgi:predicted ATPase